MGKQIKQLAKDIWGILPEGPDPEDCNIFVLKDRDKILLIDAGFNETFDETRDCLKQIGFSISAVKGVLLTHAHIDHVGALAQIESESHCWIGGSSYTKEALEKNNDQLILARQHNREFQPCSLTRVLKDGQEISFGKFTLQVYETPGHTVDSLMYFEPSLGLLFSGDTILCDGGIGFLINPTGNLEAEQQSIQRISKLPVKALLPGHRRLELKDGHREVQKSLEFAMVAPKDHGAEYYKERPAFL